MNQFLKLTLEADIAMMQLQLTLETALDALEAANAETDVSDSEALMPDSDGITEADMKSDSE